MQGLRRYIADDAREVYGGDNIIFSGHVERCAYTGKPTLLFCRGKYMRGEPLIPA